MRRPLAAEHPAEIRVLKDSSTTPRGSGDVKDFVRYFQDRLEQMTRLNSALAQQTLSALQSHMDRAVKHSPDTGPQAGDTA